MSDIVKKGFFRRCIYRATGAYLLEQHIQQLEQQLEQGIERERKMEACILSLQERTDHMEVHSDAQDAHRNAIDARLRQTDASADQTRIRLEKAEEALREACGQEVIPVSAKEQQGIDRLEEKIQTMFLQGNLNFNDQVMLTNVRHKTAMEQALKSLRLVEISIDNAMPEDFFSIDLMDAYEHLGTILGESLEEDLVNEIFSHFCMGK